jgi:molybdopterin-guanine dinucleotide biosynthesis protein A
MTAAAILTGGLARRFHGLDKSGLVVSRGDGDDGRPILEHQLACVAPVAGDILIVTSEARAADFPTSRLPPAARVVIDHYPGTGPLGAVLTALESTPSHAVIVLAADMPHVSAPLLAALVRMHDRSGDYDATVPESAHGPEPLCAVYGASARPLLRAALESGDLSMRGALDRLRVRAMPLDAVAALGDPAVLFRNINSPGDL